MNALKEAPRKHLDRVTWDEIVKPYYNPANFMKSKRKVVRFTGDVKKKIYPYRVSGMGGRKRRCRQLGQPSSTLASNAKATPTPCVRFSLSWRKIMLRIIVTSG